MCEYVLRSAADVAVDNVIFPHWTLLHRSFSFASFFFAICSSTDFVFTGKFDNVHNSPRPALQLHISCDPCCRLETNCTCFPTLFLLSRFHASHWSRLPSAHRFCVFISLKFNESTTKSVIVFNAVQNICMDTHQTRCIELLATMNETLLFLFISCFCIYFFILGERMHLGVVWQVCNDAVAKQGKKCLQFYSSCSVQRYYVPNPICIHNQINKFGKGFSYLCCINMIFHQKFRHVNNRSIYKLHNNSSHYIASHRVFSSVVIVH